MKELTRKEFERAPEIIKTLYSICKLKIFAPPNLLKECLEKYPEYFLKTN